LLILTITSALEVEGISNMNLNHQVKIGSLCLMI
jgi:hypothetical protein